MRRPFALPVVALAVLAVFAGAAYSQAPKKPDVIGTWLGTAVVGDDGSQVELTVVIEKSEAGYSGKLSDSSGMVPETPLRQIALKDNKLTFEFDLLQGAETSLIKIELLLDQETLKGVWFDPDGNSGAIELALKK
jgi:hypothetical protein